MAAPKAKCVLRARSAAPAQRDDIAAGLRGTAEIRAFSTLSHIPPRSLNLVIVAALGWSGVLQVLALASGLAAAATFTFGRLDTRRGQASGVYIVHGDHDAWHMNMDDHEAAYVEIGLHNSSKLPILDVAVLSYQFGKRRWNWRSKPPEQWLGPWGKDRDDPLLSGAWLGSACAPTIPAETTAGPYALRAAFTRPAGYSDENLRPPIAVSFRDAAGRRWVRWHDGKLSRRWG